MIKWLPYLIDLTSILIWLKLQFRTIMTLSRWQLVTLISTIIYIIVVSYLTLAPTSVAFVGPQQVVPLMVAGAPVNLIPFWSTTADFYQNVLMMLPLGVYVALIKPEFKLKKVFFSGIVISTAIEAAQFVLDITVGLSRWVDINDVLTNALGVLVGWGMIFILKKTPLKKIICRFCITGFH